MHGSGRCGQVLKVDGSKRRSSNSSILAFGRSTFGPWMTTAARGGPAMCIVEWAANRAQVTVSLHSGVS